MYNSMLITAIQQVIPLCLYIYTFSLLFFSIMIYHRVLNMFVHCAYTSLYLLTLNSYSITFPLSTLLATTSLFSTSLESVSALSIGSYHILDSTCSGYDMVFVFLFLTCLVWKSLGPSMLLKMALFHSFLWLSNIPLHICTISSLFIPLSIGI